MDDANGVLGALVALSRDVPTAHADADAHVQRAAIGNGANDVLGVNERELGGNLHIGAGHRARALDRNGGRGFRVVLGEGRENKALHVEDDIGDVFDDAFSGRELVLNAFDLDSRGFGSVQRRQQNATHAVTQRVSETTLKRLDDEAGDSVVHFFGSNGWPHELCHSL